MAGRMKRELIKTKYVNLTILPLHPPESCGGVWELLTVLEGFKGEPEEDDGVEEAVQTMGPEDLQKRGQKDGGGRKGGGGGVGGGRFQEGRAKQRDGKWKKEKALKKKRKKKGAGSSSLPSDPWPGPFVTAQR